MKQGIFRRTVCPNESNKIFGGDLKIITITEEAEEEITKTRVKKRQTSLDKRAMKLIM